MTGRLVDALRAVDPEVTGAELAAAVWLVEQIARRTAGDAPRAGGALEPESEPRSADQPGTGSGIRTEDRGAPTPPHDVTHRTHSVTPTSEADFRSRSATEVVRDSAEWHLPARGRVLDPPGWMPVRSPGADAFPGALATSRAMRALHRRVPSRNAVAMDEEATAHVAVEQDLWLPVQHPVPDRWLDLVLVVDVSASMAIWRRQVDGLRRTLEQLGAFRDVRHYHFDGDAAGERLTLRSGTQGRAGTAHDARELVDPARRRAVLVVSDCVGLAWGTDAVGEALRVWGCSGPVAVVQTLPQRLWPACRPELHSVRLRTVRRATPNAELEVLSSSGLPAGPPFRTDGTVPVPVLELQPRWLRPWADLVANPGPSPMRFTVLAAGGRPIPSTQPSLPAPDEAEPEVVGPEELLRAFRGQASTDALQLAQYLAAAPLSLPVMRLVQQALQPRSQPSVLAEIFLSGLLEKSLTESSSETPAPPAADPDDVEYDFVPGIRERLLEGLPRHDQLAVLGEVSRFIAARIGSPNDFLAFLSGKTESSEIVRDRAFARVALHVLVGLGGRYAEVAHQLGHLIGLPHTAERPPDRGSEFTDMQPLDQRRGGSTAIHSEPEKAHSSALIIPGALFRAGTSSSVIGSRRIFGNVPLRNSHFTGRVELLERLHALMRAGTARTALLPHALHGMGGVGKTQTAIEYCWRYAQEYDLVWWLRAESPTTVRQGFVELAQVMGLPEAEFSKQVLNVLDVLQDRRAFPQWLVVFDNANAPRDVQDYIPSFGNVLITSRNPEWTQVAEQLRVDVFTREESITLLQRRGSGIAVRDADKLAARLGDLPLALDQAAAWQTATGAPVAELERLLEERMAPLMSEPPANYPASLMATWDLAFTELNERFPGAARLLELLAFFGPDPIAIPLLQDGRTAELREPLHSVLQDEIKLRRAIREIGRYALAKPNAGKDEVEIHRLVQAVLRERLTPQEREATRDAVHRVIGAANPQYPDFSRTWARHAQLLPHITPAEVIFGRSESGHRAALDQIRYRYTIGDYERSEAMAESAVSAWRDLRGPDDELTLIAQRHLALAMTERGRYSEAAELNQQTLERMHAVFGPDHEHTLATLRNIGQDLRQQGRYGEAYELDADTFEQHKRQFGLEEPDTLRAMNNVAVSLKFLGRAKEALALDVQCLELRQQILGPDNPSTLISLAGVARDLADAGRYAEAHTLLIEAEPRLAQLGAGHRVRLNCQQVLALVLRRSGAVARSAEVAEETYDDARRAFPESHAYVLSATVTLANALLAVDERSRARSFADQAWQGYRRAFGPDHPSTLAAALDLAVILREIGDHTRALELDRTCLDTLTVALGESHPYVLVAMINLAHDFALTSDFVRANELSGLAFERSRGIRGEERPETLICGLNHALDLRATGEQQRSQELFERMQITLRRDYGEEHAAVRAANQLRRAEADIELWVI